jgi:hypothetical protein
MRAILITALLALSLAISAEAWADADGCNDATESYNSAISDIEGYLRRYARCVSDSQGNDDCSSEFRRLRSAQDDFESAVSNRQSECND